MILTDEFIASLIALFGGSLVLLGIILGVKKVYDLYQDRKYKDK